jgi:5-methylcytosine-specific restriction protein A
MTRRRSFSAKDRARIFAANSGTCHICSGAISVGEAWEVEHVIAWALTRDDSDANLRPAHKKCHREEKTGKDVAVIAQAKRREAIHTGAVRPKGFPKPMKPERVGKPVLAPRNLYEAKP